VCCLESVSSNSGPGVFGGLRTDGGAVGETRSSRHSLWRAGAGAGVSGVIGGGTRPARARGLGTGTCADWKA